VGTPGDRSPALAEVPTLRELGVAFPYSYWHGLLAPRGLDPAIVARLDEEVRRTLAKPEVRARFIEQGAAPVGGNGEALRRVMAGEPERWIDVIRSRQITRE
jgi:tripartite-type tricarboxylate transporter receptor subunit TctC